MINLETQNIVHEIVNICIDKEFNISINTTLKTVYVNTKYKSIVDSSIFIKESKINVNTNN